MPNLPRVLAAVLLAASLAVTACGSDTKNSTSTAGTTVQTSFNEGDDARFTEDEVGRLAGFKKDTEYGITSWTGPNDCGIAVVMTTRGQVETYASAGDPVVTNPAGDVGVKFDAAPGCRAALAAALANVK